MLLAGCVGFALWMTRPPRVHVNFSTYPFDARVVLDGVEQIGGDGRPCRTPCTIDDLPARPHRVSFRHENRPDMDAGEIDFARVQQVEFRWPN